MPSFKGTLFLFHQNQRHRLLPWRSSWLSFFPERFPLLDLVCQSLQRSIPAGAGWTCKPDWPQIWKFLVFFAKTLLENNCTNINISYGLILRTNCLFRIVVNCVSTTCHQSNSYYYYIHLYPFYYHFKLY